MCSQTRPVLPNVHTDCRHLRADRLPTTSDHADLRCGRTLAAPARDSCSPHTARTRAEVHKEAPGHGGCTFLRPTGPGHFRGPRLAQSTCDPCCAVLASPQDVCPDVPTAPRSTPTARGAAPLSGRSNAPLSVIPVASIGVFGAPLSDRGSLSVNVSYRRHLSAVALWSRTTADGTRCPARYGRSRPVRFRQGGELGLCQAVRLAPAVDEFGGVHCPSLV